MMWRDDDWNWRDGKPPRAGSRQDVRNRAAWSFYPSCSQPRDGRDTVAARRGHIGWSRTLIRREQRARRLRTLDRNEALLQRIVALVRGAECQERVWQPVRKLPPPCFQQALDLRLEEHDKHSVNLSQSGHETTMSSKHLSNECTWLERGREVGERCGLHVPLPSPPTRPSRLAHSDVTVSSSRACTFPASMPGPTVSEHSRATHRKASPLLQVLWPTNACVPPVPAGMQRIVTQNETSQPEGQLVADRQVLQSTQIKQAAATQPKSLSGLGSQGLGTTTSSNHLTSARNWLEGRRKIGERCLHVPLPPPPTRPCLLTHPVDTVSNSRAFSFPTSLPDPIVSELSRAASGKASPFWHLPWQTGAQVPPEPSGVQGIVTQSVTSQPESQLGVGRQVPHCTQLEQAAAVQPGSLSCLGCSRSTAVKPTPLAAAAAAVAASPPVVAELTDDERTVQGLLQTTAEDPMCDNDSPSGEHPQQTESATTDEPLSGKDCQSGEHSQQTQSATTEDPTPGRDSQSDEHPVPTHSATAAQLISGEDSQPGEHSQQTHSMTAEDPTSGKETQFGGQSPQTQSATVGDPTSQLIQSETATKSFQVLWQ